MFLSNSSHDRNCRQPEARIGNVRRPGNSMDRNLITCYYAEKYCDKRFFYRVFMVWQFWSLIRAQKPCDPWSLSSEPWALASEPWSQSYFGLWALSPYTMLRPCSCLRKMACARREFKIPPSLCFWKETYQWIPTRIPIMVHYSNN